MIKLGPATKRQLTEEIVVERKILVRGACKLLSLPRSQFYYRSSKDDQEVIDTLKDLPLR